jgi:hypothetical protein
MKKQKRTVLVRASIEKILAKNERRMQAIGEQSYELRQLLAKLDAEPKQTPYVKPTEDKSE